MLPTSLYEKFEELQKFITKSYKEEFIAYRRKYSDHLGEHPLFTWHYLRAMTVVWFINALFVVYRASRSNILPSRQIIDVLGYTFFALMFGCSGLVAINILRSIQGKNNFPKMIAAVDVITAYVVVPVLFTVGTYLLTLALGLNDQYSFEVLSWVWFSFLIFPPFIMAIWSYGVLFAPTVLLSITSRKMSMHVEKDELSYDLIVRNVLQNSVPIVRSHSAHLINGIRSIAERKQVGLSYQAQTLSPILGAFGLFGLFALTVTQEQVQIAIDRFEVFVLRIFLLDIQGFTGFLLIVVLMMFIVFCLVYFYRIYFVLRVLEIVAITCDLALFELDRTVAKEKEKLLLQSLLNSHL